MKTFNEILKELGNFKSTYSYKCNCQIIFFTYGKIILSYDTVCAIYLYGDKYYFTKYHNYSKTTNNHMIMTVHMTSNERIKSITDGINQLIDDYSI